MRILYIIGSLERGGAEHHLLQVTSELRFRGHQPIVFAIKPHGALEEQYLANGVKVLGVELPAWVKRKVSNKRAISWLSLFQSAGYLLWQMWRIRPDSVHFFLPMSYLMGGLVSLFGPRMQRLMSRRSLNYYQANRELFRQIELWLHPRMDLVCGNSVAVMMNLRQEGVREDQLRLIYNGIDLRKFDAFRPAKAVRGELGVADDALVFVIVANLIPYKGHSDLIEAFGIIAADLKRPWVCWCIGRNDGIGEALQAQCDALGLGKVIMFLGSRNDVPDLMSTADIGILCSHEEGFSNAILEGMAASLPMVVTDVGGNSEAVIHGQTGLVVPPCAPKALAEALLKIAHDPNRIVMGQAGRIRVQSRFIMKACVDAYEDLYREGLTKNK
jgi:glycosyltransferase involved in cell wall biosynthesis